VKLSSLLWFVLNVRSFGRISVLFILITLGFLQQIGNDEGIFFGHIAQFSFFVVAFFEI